MFKDCPGLNYEFRLSSLTSLNEVVKSSDKTHTHTAYEDGQRRCGQWNDKWRAGEQTVDHSSNALADDGLLDICRWERSKNSVIKLLRLLVSKDQSGAFTNFPSRAFIIQ